MLNRIILIGRLTKDPELRYTSSGAAVASFTLAVDRNYANQQGQREADFIRIVVWKKLAEVCANNLGKGRLVAVEGRLQVRSYDGSDGQKKQASEVIAENVRFLDWPKDGNKGPSSGSGNFGGFSGNNNHEDSDPMGPSFDIPGEDLPF
jgi:single-strand DNA-binding protein